MAIFVAMRAFKGDPKKDDVVKRMLASGNWKLGPNGELLRVSAEEANQADLQRSREAANPAKYKPTTVGFMTPERKDYLENLNRPLTPMEAREYGTVSFDPSEGANMLFSTLTPAGPVDAAATKLIGAGAQGVKSTYNLAKGIVTNPTVYTKGIKDKAFQTFAKAHTQSQLVKDATDFVANRGLGYRRFVLGEGNRIVNEVNSPEGRRRIAEQIRSERAKSGKEAFTDWEMDQVVDYKISQMQGAVDNSSNVDSRMNLLLNNASYMKFPKEFNPSPLSGPIAETAQNAMKSTTGQFKYVYPDGIKPEDKQKWNALYDKLGESKGISRPNDGMSGSVTLGIGSKSSDILEHELYHALQAGEPSPLDVEVYNVMKDIRRKSDDFYDLDQRGRRIANYMFNFNQLEGAPHLIETRDQLIKLGIISSRYDKITPDMLEKAYQITKNNPYTSQFTSAEKPRVISMIGDKSLRSDFFKQIAPLMNKLPAVGAVGAGVGLTTDGSSKDYSKGGMISMNQNPKPIRRKDRENRDYLRRFFASRRGQDILREEDVPVGTINLLPEAEVIGTPTRYQETDLAKAGLLAIREGAGMVPLLGETLDYAESAYANKYGTDFFGNPMYGPLNAAITTAGIVVPNVVEKPVKAGVKAIRKAVPKINPKVKKFESSIDWGKWNPDTPKNKDLMKEYREIEKRTKEDGTWMKNPDGTKFDGPPELFIQMQSKAFKKAFPEGFDRMYRGVDPIDGDKISPNIQTPNSSGPTFFSGDRKQAARYAGQSGNRILGADYYKKKRGVFDVAYPSNTSRLDIDTRGSNWEDVRKYDKEDIQKRIEEINQKIEGRKRRGTNWFAFEDDIWYINKGAELEAPKRVSSDEEIAAFLDKYYDWTKTNPDWVFHKDTPDFYRSADDLLPADAISTDDFQAFMERNPDLYDRVVFRGLNDDGFGDVSIVNAGKAPYPKSLKGNVGTFDLSDPNVFKALVPIIGMSAAIKLAKSQGVENPGEKMSKGGMISMKKKPTGMSAIRK